jgi:hypothetical protein
MAMQWIKVNKDSLLAEGRYIVWTTEGKWTDAAWYENTWCFALDSLNCADCKVTHWLKISPPNEG